MTKKKSRDLTLEEAEEAYHALICMERTMVETSEFLWGSNCRHPATKKELVDRHKVCTEETWAVLMVHHRDSQRKIHAARSAERLKLKRKKNLKNGLTYKGEERKRAVKGKKKGSEEVCECGKWKKDCKKKPLNPRDKVHPDCYREGLLRATEMGHMVEDPNLIHTQYFASGETDGYY